MKNLFLGILIVLSFSCSGASPIAPVIDNVSPVLPQGIYSSTIPNTLTNNIDSVIYNNNTPLAYDFFNKLKPFNIILSNSEIQLLQKYQTFVPVGKWAYSENKTPKDTLEDNFVSYKNSFTYNKPNNSSEYMEMAIRFLKSTNYYAKYYLDSIYYKNRGKILVIRWDLQTKEFAVIHPDGRVSNYQMADNLSISRYIDLTGSMKVTANAF